MKPVVFIRRVVWCSLVLLPGCGGTAGHRLASVNEAKVNAARHMSGLAMQQNRRNPVRQVVNVSDVGERMAALSAAPFVSEQLRFSRVRAAREATEQSIEQMFRERHITYPASEVYLRIFKHERSLELWVRSANMSRFELLHTYPICAMTGGLGPKRKKGDLQVPEGFYSVDLFNPGSTYHLSMRINYPNQRDRAINTSNQALGGDIFIHGGCVSAGCVAITDEAIREVYWIAVTARGMGQEHIPVHIFPARLDNVERVRKIKRLYAPTPTVQEFWETLRPGYDYFQVNRQLPTIATDTRGRYRLASQMAVASGPIEMQ